MDAVAHFIGANCTLGLQETRQQQHCARHDVLQELGSFRRGVQVGVGGTQGEHWAFGTPHPQYARTASKGTPAHSMRAHEMCVRCVWVVCMCTICMKRIWVCVQDVCGNCAGMCVSSWARCALGTDARAIRRGVQAKVPSLPASWELSPESIRASTHAGMCALCSQ